MRPDVLVGAGIVVGLPRRPAPSRVTRHVGRRSSSDAGASLLGS